MFLKRKCKLQGFQKDSKNYRPTLMNYRQMSLRDLKNATLALLINAYIRLYYSCTKNAQRHRQLSVTYMVR
jgi:hypothetical protein